MWKPPTPISDPSDILFSTSWCIPLVLKGNDGYPLFSKFCVPTIDHCLAARKFAKGHSGLLRIKSLGDCVEE